jgi:hypothetical protein
MGVCMVCGVGFDVPMQGSLVHQSCHFQKPGLRF